MAGFGSLGGLGGRPGGFGASFPSRSGSPNSQVVDYLRPQDEWQKDWDARRAAEAAKARAPSWSNSAPEAPSGALGWQDTSGIGRNIAPNVGSPEWFQANRGLFGEGAPIAEMAWSFQTGGDPNYAADAPIANYGLMHSFNGPGQSSPTAAPPNVVQSTYDPGYTPDFTALNREREQMMGRYDAQARNQQAYDGMMGNGQINGILGANYSDPNFGQVVGATPQGPSQEDMAWADGLYNPTGTYGTAPSRTNGWSFW